MRKPLLAACIAIGISCGWAQAAEYKFAPFVSVQLTLGSYPDSIQSGDFNGDGRDDVVLVPGDGSPAIVVLFQTPDGTLAAPVRHTLRGTVPATRIALADFNSDSILDIAVGRKDGLTLLLSDGAGSQRRVDNSSLGDCSQARAADFDGDNRVDLLCQRWYEGVYTLRGNGKGGFASPVLAAVSDDFAAPRAYAGDVTGDLLPDILLAEVSTFKLYVNRGDGTWLNPKTYQAPFEIQDFASGDLNSDGLDELVVSGYEGLAIYQPDGSRGISEDYRRLHTEAIAPRVLAHDLDGNGRTDLLLGAEMEAYVERFMQDENGLSPFSEQDAVPLEGYNPMAVGDVNGDGCMDVLATSWSNLNILHGMECVPPAVRGDYDADGRADLLWSNVATGAGAIWLSADYTTQQHVTRVINRDWSIVATGDFDGDHTWDIVWRNHATGAGTIWNGGNSADQTALMRITDHAWKIVGSGDYDGDGRNDLLWRHMTSGRNALWKGGDYRNQLAITDVTDVRWKVAANGDFNGDGKDDILWHHTASGSNVIWRSGNYLIQQTVTTITDLDWNVEAAGDFDGDGIDDLFWRHANGSNVIWRSASYARQQTVARQPGHWKLAAAADYDGNGRDDVIWRDSVDGSNVLWPGANAAATRSLTAVRDQNWVVRW